MQAYHVGLVLSCLLLGSVVGFRYSREVYLIIRYIIIQFEKK